jgi:hypothetical protein
VPGERRPRGHGTLAHRRPPALVAGGQRDLGEHQVDHAVEDVALVGDVVIERHRFDAECLREPPHGHGVDPLRVGEFDGASRGLGYLLSFAQSTYNAALMFALIFLIMVVVLVIV